MILTFFVFHHIYYFSVTLVQKIKIVNFSWNLVPRLIWICRSQCWCSLFLFYIINALFEQISSKKSKFLVSAEIWYRDQYEYAEFKGDVHFYPFWINLVQKVKIVSLSWNLASSLIRTYRVNSGVHFFCIPLEKPLLGNLVQTIKTVSLSWNLVLKLISIHRFQWSSSFFTIFDRKYPFWVNLVKKIKIASLCWNLVPRLIWICRIQWWLSLFLFYTRNTLFRANLIQKIRIVCLSLNLKIKLILIHRIQWWYYFLPFLTGSSLSGHIWSKKSKLSV